MASKFWINVSSQIDKQKNKQKRPISFSAVSHQTENSYPLSRKIIKWLCYKSKFPKTKIDATNWQYALQFSSVQSLSHVRLLVTPRAAAQQPSLSISKYRSLTKLMSIESVMPSNHLILYHPLFLPPSIFPRIRFFSNESVLHIRWPKCWSFSFSISPFNEYSGLISFRIDWLDLLAVQGTHKSLLQHHSSKASTLQCSAFFIAPQIHTWQLEKP